SQGRERLLHAVLRSTDDREDVPRVDGAGGVQPDQGIARERRGHLEDHEEAATFEVRSRREQLRRVDAGLATDPPDVDASRAKRLEDVMDVRPVDPAHMPSGLERSRSSRVPPGRARGRSRPKPADLSIRNKTW